MIKLNWLFLSCLIMTATIQGGEIVKNRTNKITKKSFVVGEVKMESLDSFYQQGFSRRAQLKKLEVLGDKEAYIFFQFIRLEGRSQKRTKIGLMNINGELKTFTLVGDTEDPMTKGKHVIEKYKSGDLDLAIDYLILSDKRDCDDGCDTASVEADMKLGLGSEQQVFHVDGYFNI